MPPGRLPHKLTLQKRTLGNTLGDMTETWTDIGSIWALVRPLSTAERMQAAQVQVTATHRVFTRWWSEVNAERRFEWIKDGSTRHLYPVGGPRNLDEGDRWLEIVVREDI